MRIQHSRWNSIPLYFMVSCRVMFSLVLLAVSFVPAYPTPWNPSSSYHHLCDCHRPSTTLLVCRSSFFTSLLALTSEVLVSIAGTFVPNFLLRFPRLFLGHWWWLLSTYVPRSAAVACGAADTTWALHSRDGLSGYRCGCLDSETRCHFTRVLVQV